MSSLIRPWWIWVLALALPLQGMSATLMRDCDHHHLGLQQVLNQAASAHAPAGQAHVHHHPHASTGHDHNPDHFQAHQTSGSSDHAARAAHASSCSACAMCCLVMALPVRFTLPQVQVLAQSPESFIPLLIPMRSPDRLDRPPRSALA